MHGDEPAYIKSKQYGEDNISAEQAIVTVPMGEQVYVEVENAETDYHVSHSYLIRMPFQVVIGHGINKL